MATEFNFTGKVVLITGSSGGLGSVMAREFAKRGANLVITGRRQDGVDKVINECSALSPNGAQHHSHLADVTKKEDLQCLKKFNY